MKVRCPSIRIRAGSIALAVLLTAPACSREGEVSSSGEADASSRLPAPAPAPETPSDAAVARMLAPWTGDLDGMIERRYVRMLVSFSRTNYFLDKAEQRGITHEMGKLFEAFLNERLRSKQIRIHVAFIPVSRIRVHRDVAIRTGRRDR